MKHRHHEANITQWAAHDTVRELNEGKWAFHTRSFSAGERTGPRLDAHRAQRATCQICQYVPTRVFRDTDGAEVRENTVVLGSGPSWEEALMAYAKNASLDAKDVMARYHAFLFARRRAA